MTRFGSILEATSTGATAKGAFVAESFARVRALIAHPDGRVRRVLTDALRADGYGEVAEVADGYGVVSRLAQWTVQDGRGADLLVLAPGLKGRSGLELCAGLRQSEWAAPTLFVAEEHDVIEGIEAASLGAFVVQWPCDSEDFRGAAFLVLCHGDGIAKGIC